MSQSYYSLFPSQLSPLERAFRNAIQNRDNNVPETIGSNRQILRMDHIFLIGDRNMEYSILEMTTFWIVNPQSKPVLSAEKFTALPITKIEETEVVCSICQDKFEIGEDAIKLPCACKYFYHKDCIGPWLTQRVNSCPICKKEVK